MFRDVSIVIPCHGDSLKLEPPRCQLRLWVERISLLVAGVRRLGWGEISGHIRRKSQGSTSLTLPFTTNHLRVVTRGGARFWLVLLVFYFLTNHAKLAKWRSRNGKFV
jgi:hypothetical protein